MVHTLFKVHAGSRDTPVSRTLLARLSLFVFLPSPQPFSSFVRSFLLTSPPNPSWVCPRTRASRLIINYPFFTSRSFSLLFLWRLSLSFLFISRDSQLSLSRSLSHLLASVYLFIFHLFRGHFACRVWPILHSPGSRIDCFMSFVCHSVRKEERTVPKFGTSQPGDSLGPA